MHFSQKLICLCLVCLLLPGMACAQMHLDEKSPEGWKDKNILRIIQFDTNRSDCLLLECGGETMLIDGGYYAFRKDVADFLTLREHQHLTYMLNTHPHDDHIPVMTELVKAGFTTNVFLSPFEKDYDDNYQRRAVHALDAAGIPYQQMHDRYEMSVGGAHILVRTREISIDVNRRSAMLKITFGNSVALLCADIPRMVQEAYLEDMGAEALKCDICKAPHHGISPFSVPFLEAIAPEVVTIPNNNEIPEAISGQCRVRGIASYKSGNGVVFMETDGVDWYVWQLPHGEWE